MIEFLFMAVVIFADGAPGAGVFMDEDACRAALEETKQDPHIIAVSSCYKVKLQRNQLAPEHSS